MSFDEVVALVVVRWDERMRLGATIGRLEGGEEEEEVEEYVASWGERDARR